MGMCMELQGTKRQKQIIEAIKCFWTHILTREKFQKHIDHSVKVLPHVKIRKGQAT